MESKKKLTDPVFSLGNKLYRYAWNITYLFFFKFTPIYLFHFRVFILKIFGAKVHRNSRIYPTAKIWSPKNLIVKSTATIGPFVNIYNQGLIQIESNVIISQGAHICASTHDYNNFLHPLVLSPILICENSWICSDAFIGPGVTVAEGTVVGARAVLTKDTEQWFVYAGNPAKKIKARVKF